MSERMRSSEFGEWLLREIVRTRRQAHSANPERALPANLRLQSLKLAKQVLRESLTTQQAMLDAAREARRQVAVQRSPIHPPNL